MTRPLALSLLLFATCAQAYGDVTDDTMAGIVADQIYNSAKDPTALRFISLGTPDGEAWCAIYSGTNSFNARVTEQFYFSNKTSRGSKSPGDFNKHCSRPLRKDYSAVVNAIIVAERKKLLLP